MLKLKFFIPEGLKEMEEVKEIESLLEKVKSKQIITSKQIIDETQQYNLKSQFLWSLSVYRKIKIKQTQKTKSLYPVLIVFDKNEKALTFYPQCRGGEEISIKEFLDGLLKNKIKCLHENENNFTLKSLIP